MRIARYPLVVQPYQTLEPLWPGTFVAATVTPRYADPTPTPAGPIANLTEWVLEMHAMDNHEHRTAAPPIIGIWLIHAGDHFPDELIAADAYHRGTVVYHGSVLHVFTAVIGYAETSRSEPIKADTVDEMAAQIAARHAKRAGK